MSAPSSEAWNRSPTWFLEESMPSMVRTEMRVPAGTVTNSGVSPTWSVIADWFEGDLSLAPVSESNLSEAMSATGYFSTDEPTRKLISESVPPINLPFIRLPFLHSKKSERATEAARHTTTTAPNILAFRLIFTIPSSLQQRGRASRAGASNPILRTAWHRLQKQPLTHVNSFSKVSKSLLNNHCSASFASSPLSKTSRMARLTTATKSRSVAWGWNSSDCRFIWEPRLTLVHGSCHIRHEVQDP